MTKRGQGKEAGVPNVFRWDGEVLRGLHGLAEALGADRPSPGGGAAALVASGLAAGLLAKVARVSARHAESALAEAEEAGRLRGMAEEAELAARRLIAWAPEDGHVFEAYMAALRLPRSTPEERNLRRVALDRAASRATAHGIAAAEAMVAELARGAALEGRATPSILADVHAARDLLTAALRTTLENAAQNARSDADRERVASLGRDVLGCREADSARPLSPGTAPRP